MKPRFGAAALLGILLTSCGTAPTAASAEDGRLTVFAAASLADAFTEIGSAFEAAHPGVEVVFSFAGSQTLRTQIEAGAHADVFASANSNEMDALVASGMVAAGAPQVFLSNQLVVILPPGNPAGLERLQEIARPGIKLILAAEEVPVGNYSRQALEKMNNAFGLDFKDLAIKNVVSNEDNVKQAVAKVQLGEADAGIVYASEAVAAPDLGIILIPPKQNIMAVYPIAPLVDSAHAKLAAGFISYVLLPEGQAILQKWGFGRPE